jgi:hypothetical protein
MSLFSYPFHDSLQVACTVSGHRNQFHLFPETVTSSFPCEPRVVRTGGELTRTQKHWLSRQQSLTASQCIDAEIPRPGTAVEILDFERGSQFSQFYSTRMDLHSFMRCTN